MVDLINVYDGLHNAKVQFGATGNGVTNDTAAIQAAIDAAVNTGTGVYLAPGTYSVNDLVIPAPIRFVGGGSLGTVLRARAGTNIMLTLGIGTNFNQGMLGLSIENIWLHGSDVANYGIRCENYGGTRLRLRDVIISDVSGTPGIAFSNVNTAFSMSLFGLIARHNNVGVALVGLTQESKIGHSQIYGNSVNQVTIGDGLTTMGKVSISDTQIEPTSTGASGSGLLINGVAMVSLVNVYGEAKTGAIEPLVEIAPGLTSRLYMASPYFNGNSVAPYAMRLPSDNTQVSLEIHSPVFTSFTNVDPIQNLEHANHKITILGWHGKPDRLVT